MKKTYIRPIAYDIYSQSIMQNSGGWDPQVPVGSDTQYQPEPQSKKLNATAWDDEDDNWGFSGF